MSDFDFERRDAMDPIFPADRLTDSGCMVGCMVGTCLTALSAQIGYIVPYVCPGYINPVTLIFYYRQMAEPGFEPGARRLFPGKGNW